MSINFAKFLLATMVCSSFLATSSSFACSLALQDAYFPPEDNSEFSSIQARRDHPGVDGYRNMIPQFEVLEVHRTRDGCANRPALHVTIRLSVGGGYGPQDLGFYFLAVSDLQDANLFGGYPQRPLHVSEGWSDTGQREAEFFFYWGDLLEGRHVPEVLEVMVFAVGPDGLIGRPTTFPVLMGDTSPPD